MAAGPKGYAYWRPGEEVQTFYFNFASAPIVKGNYDSFMAAGSNGIVARHKDNFFVEKQIYLGEDLYVGGGDFSFMVIGENSTIVARHKNEELVEDSFDFGDVKGVYGENNVLFAVGSAGVVVRKEDNAFDKLNFTFGDGLFVVGNSTYFYAGGANGVVSRHPSGGLRSKEFKLSNGTATGSFTSIDLKFNVSVDLGSITWEEELVDDSSFNVSVSYNSGVNFIKVESGDTLSKGVNSVMYRVEFATDSLDVSSKVGNFSIEILSDVDLDSFINESRGLVSDSTNVVVEAVEEEVEENEDVGIQETISEEIVETSDEVAVKKTVEEPVVEKKEFVVDRIKLFQCRPENRCGKGLFNICDWGECYSECPNYVFTSGWIFNGCEPCTLRTTCADYSGFEKTCKNDPCLLNNCAWERASGNCIAVSR